MGQIAKTMTVANIALMVAAVVMALMILAIDYVLDKHYVKLTDTRYFDARKTPINLG